MALKIPSLQLLRISLCATFRPDSDFEEDPGADAVFDFVVGLMHELPTLTLLRIKGSKKHWNYAARRSLNVTEGAGHVGNRVQLLTGSDADRVDHIFEAFWSMQ